MLANWILALAIGVVALLDTQAARAQMFNDRSNALKAVKNVAPRGSTCDTGGHFRAGYGEEIAYCLYDGREVRFRLAAAENALLMDFWYDVIVFDRDFPNQEIDSVIQGYMKVATELFQQFSFTIDDLHNCISEQQVAYKERLEWHPDPLPEQKSTRIRHPPLVLRC
jgi:hypothetical protein